MYGKGNLIRHAGAIDFAMRPAPSGDGISQGPSFVPEASACVAVIIACAARYGRGQRRSTKIFSVLWEDADADISTYEQPKLSTLSCNKRCLGRITFIYNYEDNQGRGDCDGEDAIDRLPSNRPIERWHLRGL